MSNLYWLSQITAEERFLVGEKAFLLSQFLQSNFSIMPGLILDNSVFEEFISVLDSSQFLVGIFPQSALYLSMDNHRALQSVASKSRRTILSTAFPEELKTRIFTGAQKLNSPQLILRPSLIIVRSQQSKTTKSLSSQTKERNYTYSGSNLLRSQVCNCNPKTIALGVKRIWADLFSAKSLLYWDRLGIGLQQLRVTILIQPIKNAIASGTVTRESKRGIIRANWGLGHSLQRGEVEADRYLVNIPTATVSDRKIGFKTHGYRLLKEDLSTTESERPQAAKNRQLLRESSLTKVAEPNLQGEQSRKLSDNLELYLIEEADREKAVLDSSQIKSLVGLIEEISLKNPQICYFEWTLLPQITNSSRVNFSFTQLSNRPSALQEDTDEQSRLFLDGATQTAESGTTSNNLHHQRYASSRPIISSPSSKETHLDRPFEITLPHNDAAATQNQIIADSPRLKAGNQNDDSLASERVSSSKILLRGIAAAKGRVTAKVVLDAQFSDRKKEFPPGTILVTKIIQPQEISLLQNLGGIITEVGGRNSHGAILARELGIPAIVNATNATEILSREKIVTLDGDRGLVYTSSTNLATKSESQESQIKSFYTERVTEKIPLATKLMVNLSQPQSIEQTAKLPIDGVGLIRGEFMLLEALSMRSLRSWLQPDLQTELLEYISAAIRKFAVGFAPKPIYYRSLDFPLSETKESNSVLGIRGTAAYLLDPTLFELELKALAQIMAEGNHNIKLILPFVRSLREWQFCRDLVEKAGLTSYPNFQLWMMVEVPSAIFLLPEYIKAGVRGIAIGTNDLTQLLLGIDREEAIFADRGLDSNSPAVQKAIAQLIETARTHHIPCSICLSASSNNSELIDKLVRWGVTAISVEAQTVTETYREIARVEKRLLLDR